MKVLIIDDEALARESLKMQIRKFSACPVFEAKDGAEALACLQEENPDLVFVDIQMPGMSGIDFMEQGRKLCSQAFFIVLSGYDSFEYAQQAIRYRASEYLLKPVSDQKVRDVLREMELRLIAREQEKNKYKEILISERKKRKSLKRKYIYELLNVNRERRSGVMKKMEELGIQFDKPYFQIFLIRMGGGMTPANQTSLEELQKFGIWNIAEEVFEGEEQSVELFDDINGVGILLNTSHPPYEQEFEKRIDTMFEETNRFCEFIGVNKVTFGIGERKQGMDLLDEVYDSAKQALNLYLTGGEQRLYFPEREKGAGRRRTVSRQIWEKRFSKALFMEDEEAVVECVNDFYDQYVGGKLMSIKELHKIHLSFFVLLLKALKNYETEGKIEDEFYLYNKIQKLESIEEMKRFLLEKVDIFFQIIRTQSVDGNQQIVQRGKQFIEENLGNELTLNSAAEYAGVSAVYFSKIFKEEEKKNFIDYVTERRMEIACELLETNMKTEEISERIGYHDVKHFYKVFKRYMGVSPGQYRRKVR